MLSWLGRAAIRISAGSLLTAIVAGIPAWLVIAVGWPLPASMPDRTSLSTFLTGGVTDRMVVNLLAIAIWLVWALFTQAVVAELRATIRGVKDLHLRAHRNPLRSTASILVSSMLLGTVLTATAATASPHAAAGAAVTTSPRTLPAVALATVNEGPATILVGDETYVYVVKRADSLSKISAAWLGNADRWPEICQLNKHRHFATVGGTLRDCNLIFPGWDLRLPADAKPPASAKTGTHHPANPPATSPTASASPPSTAPASAAPSRPPTTTTVTPPSSPATVPSSAAPSSAAAPSRSATAPVPAASPTASGSPASPASASGSASSGPASSSPDTPGPVASSEEHGVQLSPLSWVSWTLAAAISAAALLVWRQRRRRYTGEPDDAPPTELPPPVVTLRRAVNRNPELANPDNGDTEPPGLPELAPLPPGGTGLVGDGATAAARAALVAVLASGGPHHPDARAEVIIDAATLATLLGPDVVTLGPWPRLQLTDNIDDALTAAEARLLHRSRILDEHTLTDLGQLRQTAPDEEALPPVMLITETPPAGARMRAKVALALGESLHVSALLLGEWAHGATIKVAADGHTTLVAGHASEPVPARLPVLEPDAAIQVLTTLREAQTGEPPAITTPSIPVTVVPLHASRTENTPTDTTPPTVAASGPAAREPAPAPPAEIDGRARLRVLGRPRIEDITAEGRPLRAKALELAVYLAVHPDGAATREIGEYLEPDARVNQADQRVHTNASNLRHVLGRAGSAEAKNAYVIKSAGRYRLDAATVDVDVWTLRDLMRKATIATAPHRRELLTAACDLCSAPLAEGQDYEWIQPHRETVRRWGTEAHLMLADDLLDSDPQAASDLLDKAIGMDRYNEALYVKAMHARHALGDADGIRTLLRALTKALADLDAEPREDTLELANTLRTSLDSK
ncbi:transcriptional regulator [Actinoplanes sp. NPDC020271]|uniref:transcriptional regulator n=1 Tax=Actinoplanes sp. NPDC020271 TaxID=3363896 RepID=UPI00379C04D7